MGGRPDATTPPLRNARVVKSSSSEDLKACFEAEAVPLPPRLYGSALRITLTAA